MAAISRLEQHVACEIENVRIDRRKQKRGRAQKAILARAHRLGSHVLDLAREAVVARGLAAVDQMRVERIGSDVAVLFHAHGTPVAEGDLAVVAAAGDAG